MLTARPSAGIWPAAFGRLCVETSYLALLRMEALPAAFGRLCVETRKAEQGVNASVPAAFGRLCVETKSVFDSFSGYMTSRLRAAVC